MSQDWDIKACNAECCDCKKAFADREKYQSRLVHDQEGYRREDHCEACWAKKAASGAVPAVSVWRGSFRAPMLVQETLKKETAESLLRKLMESADPARRNAIYVLAVMLERKRMIVEREVRQNEDGTKSIVYEHKETGEAIIVTDPCLKLDQIADVQKEIVELLSGMIPGKGQDPAQNEGTGGERVEVKGPAVVFDIKIVNGTLVDGTGTDAEICDVGIAGDAIAEVGNLQDMGARTVIDAMGKVVCPGFIDAHSHSDVHILAEPSAFSKITQGITTEIVGNCGASGAPWLRDDAIPSDWRELKVPSKWRTVAEYRRVVEMVKPAVNIALLVGHKAIRAGVMGYENRPPTADELKEMCRQLEQGMEEGGRGFSAGLIYAPGSFASREELSALAKVAGDHHGLFAAHMRSEGAGLIEAIEEMIAIGRESGARVQISHLKTSGHANWHLIDKALETIRSARAGGMDLKADRYPYTAGYTDLDVVLPDWVHEGGSKVSLERIRSPELRQRIRDGLVEKKSGQYWSAIMIATTRHPDQQAFRGMMLPDIAQKLGMEPVDAILHILERDELRTTAFFHGMSEDNMRQILAESYVMLGTDASLRAPTGPLAKDFPHPRAYGAFTRFLRMALDGRSVPLCEAVRKMTSLPAGQFGLTDRGTVDKGYKADILVLDPKAVRDKATYANPHKASEGIGVVMVNGVIAYRDGQFTGHRGGWFL